MREKITSKENMHVKYAKKLSSSSRFRKKENMFIIEGIRLCQDALKSGVSIVQLFYTQECCNKFPEVLKNISATSRTSFVVTEEIMNLISDTDTPQGIVCICEKIKNQNDEEFGNVSEIVLLENIQNPSNLGSILRTCDALSLNTIAISDCSCDIYNPKALRSSMGAVFRLNVINFGKSDFLIKKLQHMGFKIYATVPESNALDIRKVDFEDKIGLVLGNEANGICRSTIDLCDTKITIPMNDKAESLNVSVAAGISIWEIMRRRK